MASYSCGIVAGIAPLWEAEGSKEVSDGLNEIWKDPLFRPEILFYDLACRRRRYLLSHPDAGWGGTLNYVDRSLVVIYFVGIITYSGGLDMCLLLTLAKSGIGYGRSCTNRMGGLGGDGPVRGTCSGS